MLDKLRAAAQRYDELNEALQHPDAPSDIENYKKLMRERKNLAPIVEKYREYTEAQARMKEAEELLSDPGSAELHGLAYDEYGEAKRDCERINGELKLLLLPRDINDDRSVVVEIRAGAGGEEAALFAGVLYRMYSMYAASHGYKCEIVDSNETELGGYKEISFTVEGEGAFSRLKFESGVHRVQRVPDTESQGRIHTSTVTVAVLPEAEEIEVEINPNDLKIDTIKATGAGGQHVNKTESAIRILHKPTGMVVECRDERSQLQNREKAMKMLRTRLYDIKRAEADEKLASERRSQVGTGERCERIRTYNYPQSRVSDHRIGFTTHNLEGVLNGGLDELIEALITADTAERLKSSEE